MAQPHETAPRSLRAPRVLQIALALASVSVIGALACDDGNGPLFRSAGGLEPLPTLDAGGEGNSGSSNAGSGGADSAAGAGGSSSSENGGSGGSGGAGSGLVDAGGAGATDAGQAGSSSEPPPSDGSCSEECVREGGRCQTGKCMFDCTEPDSCAGGQVLCPPGEPCEVRCGNRACASNVVCRDLATCDIFCEGELSCGLEVICEGTCNISCSGTRSCRGGIGGSVQLMQLECSGSQSCGGRVSCEGRDCQLECSGPQSCPRVRAVATLNRVTCSGQNACDTEIECFGGLCDLACHDNSCDGDVDCGAQACNRIDLEDPDDD